MSTAYGTRKVSKKKKEEEENETVAKGSNKEKHHWIRAQQVQMAELSCVREIIKGDKIAMPSAR
jgi:hypothetical protein